MQVILQTSMIVDGLRRCSDSHFNQKRKPGRNVIMFLLITNFATYFWDTFEIKSAEYQVGYTLLLSHLKLMGPNKI